MPKSLRISEQQARVFDAIQKAGEISRQELAEDMGFSLAEIKSLCLILMARNLIEKASKEGRTIYRVR